MVAKRVYEVSDVGSLTDDMSFLLDRPDLPEAVHATLATIRGWVGTLVDTQLSASLLASVSALDTGASTSITPNSTQGVLFVFDRDTPGRLAVFQYQVGLDAYIEAITASSVDGVSEWNPVVGTPPVTTDQIGVGVSITGAITFSNGFANSINLAVTPGRAAIVGELTIANLDQVPLLAPTPATTVLLEDQGQALRMSLSGFADYIGPVDPVARNAASAAQATADAAVSAGASVTDPRMAGGAKGDCKLLSSVTINAGALSTLIATTSAFAPTDVDKRIYVPVAGVVLATTISAYTNGTTVTLTDAASAPVAGVPCLFGTDDTAAFQAAAASAAAEVAVPYSLGGYLVTGQVVIGSASKAQKWRGSGPNTQSSRVWCLGPNVIHFLLQGAFSELEGVLLDGSVGGAFGSTGGTNYGAVGVLVGSPTLALSGQKLSLRRVQAQYFTQAGIVAAGVQNTTFELCLAQYNIRFNFAILNGTRHLVLDGCNVSDWETESDQWVTAQMVAIKPNTRNLFIGLDSLGGLVTIPTVTWATSAGFAGKVPSDISVSKGIFERASRHTYNIHAKEFYGRLWMDEVEVTHALAAGALVKVDAWQGTQNNPYRPHVDLRLPDLIPFSTERLIDAGVGVMVDCGGLLLGTVAGNVRRKTTDNDLALGSHFLDSPSRFATGLIGQWAALGTGTVASTNGRLVVTTSGTGNGAKCPTRPLANGTDYVPPTGRIVHVRVLATQLGAAIDIYQGLAGSPFTRLIGTLQTTDVNKVVDFYYPTQGDEAAEYRIAANAAGTPTATFALFAVAVL